MIFYVPNYKVVINGTVTSRTESDNNDGTSTVYYKLEPVNVELIDTLGTSIKSKDTRGKSKLLRSRLYVIWRDIASDEEFEDFYDGVMGQILFDANHIVDKYENRKK
jgi:hypothetical protein